MDVPADLGEVADGLEQVVGHVVGEVGDELDPLDAGDVVNSFEQIGEAAGAAVGLPVMVAVDRLAQEGDFLDPLIGQQPGLRQDRRRAGGFARDRGPTGTMQ